MAYKRYRGDERILRDVFCVKIMVNREDKVRLTVGSLRMDLINIA